MKLVIASEHREFFQKHQAIEFEGLLSADQIKILNDAIDASLAERLNAPLDEVRVISPGKQYLVGRDLWRTNTLIKKIVTQRQLAEIAADLIEQKSLRLGYDQLFPELPGRIYKTAISDAYHQLLYSSKTLAGMSSIDGVTCGLMLCLKSDNSGPAEEGSIFSRIQGNVIFINPATPINFEYLREHPLQRYLLIVYARNNATYLKNENDPHTHALKQLDYSFGQKLTEKWHPLILR